MTQAYDVIVVGAGNAAMAAALSAREHGANVVVLEAADPQNAGGNTRYAAGQMRTVFRTVDDLLQIVPDLTESEIAISDFGSYSREDYLEDVGRLTQYRCNPELVEVLVDNSFATLRWMRKLGVRFQVSYGRQAVKVNGRFRFWGGLPCEVWGGGPGILEAYYRAADKAGIEVRHYTYALDLVLDQRRVVGVRCASQGGTFTVRAKAVVLACGGFEANAEMRARYLGPNWDLAKVRGTKFNTGQGLSMALAIGASAAGHWSGAHSTCWDLNAPETGNLQVGDGYQKFSYPTGIMVNARGERFVDEGADLQTFTYARIGREILAQPGMFAWQVFDQRAVPLLRDEYRIKQITKVTAPTIEELAHKLEGVDARGFLETIEQFNKAVPEGEPPINLSIRDGRSTTGLALPKSNWAYRIDRGPFEAYAVTTGITFTFGGLRISPRAQVLDAAWDPIPGLYAAGEIVGGIFYGGYPGGTGLVSGAVFGRIAGREAAGVSEA
ncbi:MAG: tricarballylate dehydrogenase [Betaproteobacteria bacterium RIFCSPLOWO2_12_FULL_62_58]|nr:MAG: tricarballylate dehydrogenase [Betaproteobacteria bacterium RIFCSPLOWO2_12_FULL_62_58]